MELGGQRVENTLYFRRGTGWATVTLTTLGNQIIAWWEDNIAPLVSGFLTLREIQCTDLDSATGPSVTVVPGSTIVGGVGGDSLPNNVSLAISFRTDGRGRSSRGRNYIVGFAEGQVTGNIVSSGVMTSFVTAYNLLFDVAEALSGEWVQVSRFSGVNPTTGKPIPREEGVATPILTVLFTDNVVDSQRNRLPGRGT
jgi:hypothetical protein